MVDGVPRWLQDLWNGHDPNAFPPARFASTTRETRPRRLDDGQSGSGCQGTDLVYNVGARSNRPVCADYSEFPKPTSGARGGKGV